MKNEYDFSKGKRGALISNEGKTPMTIYVDNAVLEAFRQRAEASGIGYQDMMNEALKAYLKQTDELPVTESVLRRVLKEELHAA